MDRRLIFLIFTTIFWGIWGLAQKKAATAMNPFLVMMVQNLLIFIIVTTIAAYFKPSFNGAGIFWAVIGGLSSCLAMILFLFAIIDTRAAIAQAITAGYPVVTMILAYLLIGETITWIEGLGMAMVMGGVTLLSWRV